MSPDTHVDEQGVPRRLACVLPPARAAASVFRGWDEALGVLPRDRWAAVDYSEWLPPVLDQGSTAECGGFSTAAAHTAACQLAGRPLPTYLSPGWVYGYCREPGGGVLVRNCLTCLRDRGCPLVTTVGAFDVEPAGYSDAARREAARYRLTAAYQVRGFDELGTALQSGYVVEFGCLVGGSFRPGPGGLVPPWDGALRGGHAMVAYGLKLVGGVWHARVRNAWGPGWGDGGDCLMDESYFWLTRPDYKWCGLDAFAIKAVRGDDDLPGVGG